MTGLCARVGETLGDLVFEALLRPLLSTLSGTLTRLPLVGWVLVAFIRRLFQRAWEEWPQSRSVWARALTGGELQ